MLCYVIFLILGLQYVPEDLHLKPTNLNDAEGINKDILNDRTVEKSV